MTVYPGEFSPQERLEHIADELDELIGEDDSTVTEPLINVSELADCFKIEVSVPGVNREDFYIKAFNNLLSLTVFRTRLVPSGKRQPVASDPSSECFHRHIILPENVDADFVRAEYRDGVLCMYLPKDGNTITQSPSRIVVY
jgi:HSP20 family protein